MVTNLLDTSQIKLLIIHHLRPTLTDPVDVTSASPCLLITDSFQIVDLENMDRLFDSVRSSAHLLNPCPS